jgi:hypothetical protein
MGGRHLKFSLTDCQTLRLLQLGVWSNVFLNGLNRQTGHIMNEIHLIARLAQRLPTAREAL